MFSLTTQKTKSGYFSLLQATKTKQTNNHVLFYYKRDIRINKQIIITKLNHGNIECETYYFNCNGNNQLHRLNGPAYCNYQNGKIVTENWIINGIKQRIKNNGPTFISYHTDGSKQIEMWHSNNVLHRIGGPAYIIYDDFKEEWYTKGNFIGQTGSNIRTILNKNVFYHVNK
jgi:hypothetical protein